MAKKGMSQLWATERRPRARRRKDQIPRKKKRTRRRMV
jgi:hypothetical protein